MGAFSVEIACNCNVTDFTASDTSTAVRSEMAHIGMRCSEKSAITKILLKQQLNFPTEAESLKMRTRGVASETFLNTIPVTFQIWEEMECCFKEQRRSLHRFVWL